MVSAFKDYSSRGIGLQILETELGKVNHDRVGKEYHDEEKMLELEESPGLKVIEPTMAADNTGTTKKWQDKQKMSLIL